MDITVPLRSAAEIERLHTAAYRFAETRRDGARPHIVADNDGPMLVAHIKLDDEDAAQAFRAFWSGYRERRNPLAA
jgi:hypothetical protein